jgi:uncharacterized membrane protein YdcZ (DUF606 family)
MEQNRGTCTLMFVAILVKIPPRLAVARTIATDVALLAIMATACEIYHWPANITPTTNLQLYPQAVVHGI